MEVSFNCFEIALTFFIAAVSKVSNQLELANSQLQAKPYLLSALTWLFTQQRFFDSWRN
jgi:hypothetical protein